MNKRNPRGAGAKRKNPKIKKNSVNTKLEQYILDFLDTLPESRAVIIAQALIEKYHIEPPQ